MFKEFLRSPSSVKTLGQPNEPSPTIPPLPRSLFRLQKKYSMFNIFHEKPNLKGRFRWVRSFTWLRLSGPLECIHLRFKCEERPDLIINKKEMNVKLMLLLLVCVWLSRADNNANGGDATATGIGNTANAGTSAFNQQFSASWPGNNNANGGKATANGFFNTANGGHSIGNIQSIGCTQHCFPPTFWPCPLSCVAGCCY